MSFTSPARSNTAASRAQYKDAWDWLETDSDNSSSSSSYTPQDHLKGHNNKKKKKHK